MRAQVGDRWAYRERPRTPLQPVRPVEVVKHGPPRRSRQVRVRWLDGQYEGLIEWVPLARLVVPWDQADALLTDERGMDRLLTLSPAPLDTTTATAIAWTYFSKPGPVDFHVRGSERVRAMIEDFEARRDHLPIPAEEMLASPGAFVDSAATLHVGQDMSLHLAKSLARRHSDAVLARCNDELGRWRKALVTGFLAEGSWPDTECRIEPTKASEHLAELEAVEHLLRDWCGHGQGVRIDEARLLREDNERLRRLIEGLAHWLVASGHPSKATWLRRQIC